MPSLLESYSDFKEIPDDLPEVPKTYEVQSRIAVANYYTNLLKAPLQRDWKGHRSTILIIREDLRVLGGGLKNHP